MISNMDIDGRGRRQRSSSNRLVTVRRQASYTVRPAVRPPARRMDVLSTPVKKSNHTVSEWAEHPAQVTAFMQASAPVNLSNSKPKRSRTPKTKKYCFDKQAATSLIIAVVLFGFGMYVLVDTVITNQRAKDTFGQVQQAQDSDGSEHQQDLEGKDEAAVLAADVNSYTATHDTPRTITIEKLGIHTRVRQMGVNSDGSVQAPLNIHDTGWYTGSAKPGQNGAMFIDGHKGGPTQQGVFSGLKNLVAGDSIVIERGDGQKLTYIVRAVHTEASGSVDMNKLLSTYDGALQGLNLMTCDGKFDVASQTYTDRVSVFATL